MNTTSNRYSPFRAQLLVEKDTLAQRIHRIDEALRALDGLAGARPGRKPGRPASLSLKATRATTPGRRRGRPPGKRAGKRARNELSLRAAILKAMGKGPLTKAEILSGVQKEGYKFSASNPMNSINVLLYTKGLFKKLPGKKFTPAK